MCGYMFFVFFFKQKTAYEMRISDWSSDVCSSDLKVVLVDSSKKAESEAVPDTWLARVFRAAMLAPTCCSSACAWFHCATSSGLPGVVPTCRRAFIAALREW